ncbi:NADH:flavin oxidoreductase [Bradyrhizobium sp.]|uniref:NADH:flavin oxidoreductase n=1 Tax=Bradyrhizobium sp. TaxID=376 RepID=UPI002DDD1DC8|nr:NADH:flavin oxidoreductase [Bradyrhizobium sp.]HEV2160555.1 NADH:flavin oxidoreductase [Bradyrhizobium sp.]
MTPSPLFEPFSLKSLNLSNRVVMAPMTRSKSPDETPGDDVVAYYRKRAAGGVGLIITEGTTIDRAGSSNDVNIPNLYAPKSIEGWKKVVNAVHQAGAKIAPQIWHQGTVRKPGTGPRPEGKSDGPSGLSGSGKPIAEPMTDADIADTIDAFAAAAATAKEIGFDAVELHGAHGYLVDQFFWANTNRREDGYGGDFVQRTRFAADVIRAIRRRVGDDFVIIHRFSQWKQQDFSAKLVRSPAELESFLTPLVDAGADIFHGSTRRYWEPEFEGSDLNLSAWCKKLTGKPSLTVGSVGLKGADFIESYKGGAAEVGDLGDLEARLQRAEFDLVAVGRALISDPEWAAKIRDGRFGDLRAFSPGAMTAL